MLEVYLSLDINLVGGDEVVRSLSFFRPAVTVVTVVVAPFSAAIIVVTQQMVGASRARNFL
jgi:hypothetical protein